MILTERQFLIITAPLSQDKPNQSNIQPMWPGDCGMLGQGALKPQLFDYKPQYDLKGALQNRFLLGFNTQDTSEARLETLKHRQFERERERPSFFYNHVCHLDVHNGQIHQLMRVPLWVFLGSDVSRIDSDNFFRTFGDLQERVGWDWTELRMWFAVRC